MQRSQTPVPPVVTRQEEPEFEIKLGEILGDQHKNSTVAVIVDLETVKTTLSGAIDRLMHQSGFHCKICNVEPIMEVVGSERDLDGTTARLLGFKFYVKAEVIVKPLQT